MRIETHIKKASIILFTAIALVSCGGGGGGGGESDDSGTPSDQSSNNDSNSNDGNDISSADIAHAALSRANGKVLGLFSADISNADASKALQKAIPQGQVFNKTVVDSGQEAVDCDSGNLIMSYEVSKSDDSAQIYYDLGFQFTACQANDIATGQNSNLTISRTSEGVINSSTQLIRASDNPQQISGFEISTTADPGTTDTFVAGDISLEITTNKLDISIGYNGSALTVNGVEDITSVDESPYYESDTINQAYTYSDIEYDPANLGQGNYCPSQGSISGELLGERFTVVFGGTNIEVTKSGQSPETFNCNDVIAFSDDTGEEDIFFEAMDDLEEQSLYKSSYRFSTDVIGAQLSSIL